MVRALLFQANLLKGFWGECILTAGYLINRTPSSLLKRKPPEKILHGNTPYSQIKLFGCLAFVHDHNLPKDKFRDRSRPCIFLGHPYGKKGWRLFEVNAKKFIISRDVIFDEDTLPYFTGNLYKNSSSHGHKRKFILGHTKWKRNNFWIKKRQPAVQ